MGKYLVIYELKGRVRNDQFDDKYEAMRFNHEIRKMKGKIREFREVLTGKNISPVALNDIEYNATLNIDWDGLSENNKGVFLSNLKFFKLPSTYKSAFLEACRVLDRVSPLEDEEWDNHILNKLWEKKYKPNNKEENV